MRKIYLMSIMLMGLVSLFTSCVDVDYYDLYEDEEDSFIPRNKKGKGDFNEYDNYDYSDYPLMNDGDIEYKGFFEAECVAYCLSQLYPNKSKQWCRRTVIEAQYGCFNMNSYGAYFYSVMNNSGGNLPNDAVQDILFGPSEQTEKDVESFATLLVDNNVGSCADSPLALYSKNGRHIAKVNYVHIDELPDGGYYLQFDINDQYVSPRSTYYVELNSAKKVVGTNVECFRMCKK